MNLYTSSTDSYTENDKPKRKKMSIFFVMAENEYKRRKKQCFKQVENILMMAKQSIIKVDGCIHATTFVSLMMCSKDFTDVIETMEYKIFHYCVNFLREFCENLNTKISTL